MSRPAVAPGYRIEDLAHRSGATVRTIRAYQDRGLLPRPERRGRSNVYGDDHLARLRQIAGLLERGYTLASIKELLDAWDTGRGLGGILGLVAEVHGPWTDERPGRITRAELAAVFGTDRDAASGAHRDAAYGTDRAADHGADRPDREPVPDGLPRRDGLPGPDGSGPGDPGDGVVAAIAEAVELGVLETVPEEPDAYRVPSPQELAVAAELHAAGVPLTAISGHLRELRAQIEHIAHRFLEFTTEYVFARHLRDRPPSDAGAAEAAELVRRLRPLARSTVEAELARALGAFAPRHLQEQLTPGERPVPLPSAPPAPEPPAAPEPPRSAPGAEPPCRVELPATTLRTVRDLVGPERVAAFIASATERELHARTLDTLAGHHRRGVQPPPPHDNPQGRA
ncbi:MerR family transcriptional regulator [Streptomyces sp. LP05-1]|uniref:MerR family transcriptional regulator n=1 Tax=Streptomyces pyxinae TaxID=2970734 RepID=A0ABT2CCK8_9ACTN|nr:MerR family transcriptional regulator [Streptomyces sp. LP05-1]MCS0635148.1 MerR family transcriptional regulator [Streptomyces sp. LP05-1]